LIAFLAREVRRQNELLLEALYVSVERRVLRRLVELTNLYPAKDGVQWIPLTQDVLAELAGTSRATVNRVLNEESAVAPSSCDVAGRLFASVALWSAGLGRSLPTDA
jgi:CRP-like cAMP-binding protein